MWVWGCRTPAPPPVGRGLTQTRAGLSGGRGEGQWFHFLPRSGGGARRLRTGKGETEAFGIISPRGGPRVP